MSELRCITSLTAEEREILNSDGKNDLSFWDFFPIQQMIEQIWFKVNKTDIMRQDGQKDEDKYFDLVTFTLDTLHDWLRTRTEIPLNEYYPRLEKELETYCFEICAQK